MIEIFFECVYCGFTYIKGFYSSSQVEKETCPRCKDRNLKVKKKSDVIIDTYVGAPPFPSDDAEGPTDDPFDPYNQ